MDAPKTVSRWRIVLWGSFAAFYLWMLVHSLIVGEVVIPKSHDHFQRSREPGGYWFGIAFYAAIAAFLIHCLLTTKPHPRQPPKPPDLTPRDWMGNPLDRK